MSPSDQPITRSISPPAALAGTARHIRIAAVFFFAVMTAAAAQISIPLPFTPVPLTLQPAVVLLGAAVLGSRLGMASQMLYLLAGVAGLPVFAASPLLPAGAARLLGPTGGYLVSFPIAAAVTGYLAEQGCARRYATALLAMVAGLAVIFGGGVIWLALYPPAPLGLEAALRSGFYPFILADLVKVSVAAATLPALCRFTGTHIRRT